MNVEDMTVKQRSLIDELKEMGIKIKKVAASELIKSENLIIPTNDRNGMVKIELRERKNYATMYNR